MSKAVSVTSSGEARRHGVISSIEVDHLDCAALLAVGPHCAYTVETGGACHAEFGDLRAALSKKFPNESEASISAVVLLVRNTIQHI